MKNANNRLIIIEPRALLAECFMKAIANDAPHREILTVSSISEVLPLLHRDKQDIILLSGHSFTKTRIAIEAIRGVNPKARFILLDESPRSGGSLAAVRTSSHGYWTYYDSMENLIRGIERAIDGFCTLSPLAEHLLTSVGDCLHHHEHAPHPGLRKLTEREFECLLQLIRLRDLKQCAENMGICPRTVENFKHKIMKKLKTRSWADLVHFGHTHALVE
ncbi:MAG TPA: hypothetical protein DEB39_08470 [Planctomycetaceae bacterium]|nr:hypothetical protein [Planctomycetaceae bacterium]